MSHAATKWAFDQPEQHPDMKPGELVVLAVLADCHNPLHGCYPSHDYISARTNLSERSVRDQLARLRERGLIDWDGAREAGRRGSNRYRLAFEGDFQPANSAGSSTVIGDDGTEQTANSAGRAENDELPANSDSSTGKSRQFYRQILPPHIEEPVKEPVKEPLRESAGASEDDRKRVERWLKKVHPKWPSYVADSAPKALAAAMELSEADREAAAARMADYLEAAKGGGRKTACSFAVYLSEKRWEKLPEPEADDPDKPLVAKPFGPDWSAARLRLLLAGPSGPLPQLTLIERRMVEAGHADREALLAEKRMRTGWPEVNRLHDAASRGVSTPVPRVPDAVRAAMEPVPVGSDIYAAWRAAHAARGWPWIPDPGALPVVYLPKGGPEALQEFTERFEGVAVKEGCGA
ncbi:helix-turn-helix domain-containing protein [Jiella marina]|uniref:helix-turn-helix domain-containing protein n=1 Tax=Jiella sp. LLJ827 TaxID=2917712 RepID=UPI0021007F75|nr:helix-turn-helix domain-containing protein [Jiella sp. LLJ827]MCQ0987533.1 helix-turn-helix domain-containing protein [Jiella sp. LLJ827]